MRRRVGLLMIPVVLAVLYFLPRAPREHELRLHFGARSQQLREVDIHFVRRPSLDVARDLALYFADGAPPDAQRKIRLGDGSYQAQVRLLRAGAPEVHLSREVLVDGEGPIELDLAIP